MIMRGISRGRKRAKPFCGSRASFQRFHFAISRRSIRDQGIEQFPRDLRHAVYRPGERRFVHFGRFREAAQFSDKLKRRCTNFFFRHRRFEVMQSFDVSTHKFLLAWFPFILMKSQPAATDELVSAALNSSSNLRSQTEATRECASVVERFYEFRKWVIDEGLFDSPYFAMQTFFGSVKNRNASSPPSRPMPLCFIPPNGTRRSRTSQQFTQTVPV